MKTLQSIKKGISLLDERHAEIPVAPTDGTGAPEDGWNGLTDEADDVDDDAEEDATLPVRR